MALCIPLVFGFPTKVTPEDNAVGPSSICPNCHNASVIAAKSRTWFELFWIPLIPFTSKHIWICGICNWKTNQEGFQPQQVQGNHVHPGQQQQQGSYLRPVQQQNNQQALYIPPPPPQHPQGYAVQSETKR